METKLVYNVWSFLDKASSLYGEFSAQGFVQEMHANCLELGMQSPFKVAFEVLQMVDVVSKTEEYNHEDPMDMGV